MDQAMVLFKNEHAAELTALKEKEESAFKELEEFAIANKDALFSGKKSFSTLLGTFGYRTAKPKFTLAPNFTWPTVTNMAKVLLPNYIRTSYEIAKTKLMEDRSLPEVSRHFATLGILIVQDENFFVDLNKV